MRRLISSGSTFERDIGYSRAVVDGDWVFVSGTTGFDYETMAISDDVVEQAEQCLINIEKALVEAGSRMYGRGPGALHPAQGRGFRAVLAGAAKVFRRRAPRGYDDLGRALGPAHENRNRSDGTQIRGYS